MHKSPELSSLAQCGSFNIYQTDWWLKHNSLFSYMFVGSSTRTHRSLWASLTRLDQVVCRNALGFLTMVPFDVLYCSFTKTYSQRLFHIKINHIFTHLRNCAQDSFSFRIIFLKTEKRQSRNKTERFGCSRKQKSVLVTESTILSNVNIWM